MPLDNTRSRARFQCRSPSRGARTQRYSCRAEITNRRTRQKSSVFAFFGRMPSLWHACERAYRLTSLSAILWRKQWLTFYLSSPSVFDRSRMNQPVWQAWLQVRSNGKQCDPKHVSAGVCIQHTFQYFPWDVPRQAVCPMGAPRVRWDGPRDPSERVGRHMKRAGRPMPTSRWDISWGGPKRPTGVPKWQRHNNRLPSPEGWREMTQRTPMRVKGRVGGYGMRNPNPQRERNTGMSYPCSLLVGQRGSPQASHGTYQSVLSGPDVFYVVDSPFRVKN